MYSEGHKKIINQSTETAYKFSKRTSFRNNYFIVVLSVHILSSGEHIKMNLHYLGQVTQ